MIEYLKYKEYWLDEKAPENCCKELAFKEHINSMTTYELMELLSEWIDID